VSKFTEHITETYCRYTKDEYSVIGTLFDIKNNNRLFLSAFSHQHKRIDFSHCRRTECVCGYFTVCAPNKLLNYLCTCY